GGALGPIARERLLGPVDPAVVAEEHVVTVLLGEAPVTVDDVVAVEQPDAGAEAGPLPQDAVVSRAAANDVVVVVLVVAGLRCGGVAVDEVVAVPTLDRVVAAPAPDDVAEPASGILVGLAGHPVEVRVLGIAAAVDEVVVAP